MADAMERFLVRVSWACGPDHFVRRGEVYADVGIEAPTPPLTNAEMERITFAAKMEVLKCLRARKRKHPASPQSDPKGVDRG
jgi:hypothetical protein